MNNLIKVIIPIFLFAATTVRAQKLKIKFGVEDFPGQPCTAYGKVNDKTSQLTEDDEFYYERASMAKLRDIETILIKKINKSNGVKVWEKILPIEDLDVKKKSHFCGMQKVQSGFLVFIKYKNVSKKQCYLTSQLFDENLKPIGQEKTITTTELMDKEPYERVKYKIIPRNGKFLVYPYYIIPSDIENISYPFTLIDESQNIIWEQKIHFPQKQIYRLKSAELTGAGNLAAIFAFSTNGKSLGNQKASIEYKAAYYNHNQKKLDTNNFNFRGAFKYYSEDLIEIDTITERISIVGQYHRTDNIPGKEGIFRMTIDLASMKVDYLKTIPYSQKLRELMLDPISFKKGLQPKGYIVNGFFINEKNETIFFIQEQYVTPSPGSTIYYDYNYKDIVTVKVTENGEIVWVNYIERDAKGTRPNYTTAICYQLAEHTVVLLNATTSSASDPVYGYELRGFRESVLVAFVYDPNGNLVSKEYFTTKDSKNVNCSMLTIRKITDSTLEVNFEKTDLKFDMISTTKAKLQLIE